ncbi:MAG TPA: hypothetical protein VKP65_09520 [Rhodothermales bacterium]|nr:hypothetical protein [Rhodothermales bacterium]
MMDLVAALFDTTLLVFTIPALLAVVLWVLALIGLFDFEALDIDLDVDAPDVEIDLDAGADLAGGGGLLQVLGVGMIPFSLLLTVALFIFGWSGIMLHSLTGEILGWNGLALNLLFIPLALVIALAVTAGAARVLRPLFRDYGKAHAAADLVGKIALVKSNTVTSTFGSAVVRLGGDHIEIATRSMPGQPDLQYGTQVVIFDYDAEKNLYYVGAFEDKPSLPSSS